MKRRTAYLSPGPQQPDVALRGVMQALVRIQAYMLADIVVAIPAIKARFLDSACIFLVRVAVGATVRTCVCRAILPWY